MAETVNEETGEITEGEEPITEEQVREAEEEQENAAPEQEEGDVIEEAQASFDERAAEAGRKRIDRAVKSMVTTLNQVLADEAQYLQPCPRCADDFPGLIWQPGVKGVLPETRAAVMISMGEDPDPTLNPDPRANRCGVCDGWGKVATGSRVARQDKMECEECKGRGWVGPRMATIAAAPAAPQPVLYDVSDTNGHESPPTDPWGRVKGEPLYGIMPGYEH